MYVRVSSKEQEKEGFSIPAQRKLLQQYALDQGLDIVREFEDVETAKRSGRQAFGEMITFLAKSSCKVIPLIGHYDPRHSAQRSSACMSPVLTASSGFSLPKCRLAKARPEPVFK